MTLIGRENHEIPRSGERGALDDSEGITYICGDGGAVEIGVSVRTVPTPPLGACDDLWASECKSFPSARPTTVFGGGMRTPSFPGSTLAPLEVAPLALELILF